MSITKGVLRSSLALVASGALALFLGVSPASADNGPHVSKAVNAATTGVQISQLGADRCSSCHRAHTAQSPYLLAASSQESLCFTCHGDGGTGATTDVQSGLAYGVGDRTTSVGALRGGGFDKAALGTASASKDIYWNASRSSWSSNQQNIPALTSPQDTTSSHLGGPNTIWGNGAISASANPGTVTDSTTKLECGSCHDPHGNGQYRILKPVPVGSGFATVTTNTNTGVANAAPGVYIKDTANKVYVTTNYWIAADLAATDTLTSKYLGGTSTTNPTPTLKTLSSGTVDAYQANVSAWCTTCHTRYLAPSGSWGNTSGDAIFTYRHTGDTIGSQTAASRNNGNRNCSECHVAHGSNAAMTGSAVEYPGGSTKSTDSRLLRVDERGICLMCHNF